MFCERSSGAREFAKLAGLTMKFAEGTKQQPSVQGRTRSIGNTGEYTQMSIKVT